MDRIQFKARTSDIPGVGPDQNPKKREKKTKEPNQTQNKNRFRSGVFRYRFLNN